MTVTCCVIAGDKISREIQIYSMPTPPPPTPQPGPLRPSNHDLPRMTTVSNSLPVSSGVQEEILSVPPDHNPVTPVVPPSNKSRIIPLTPRTINTDESHEDDTGRPPSRPLAARVGSPDSNNSPIGADSQSNILLTPPPVVTHESHPNGTDRTASVRSFREDAAGINSLLAAAVNHDVIAVTPSGPNSSVFDHSNTNLDSSHCHLSVNEKLNILIDKVSELHQRQTELIALVSTSHHSTDIQDEFTTTLPIDSDQSMNDLSDSLQDRTTRRQLVRESFNRFEHSLLFKFQGLVNCPFLGPGFLKNG